MTRTTTTMVVMGLSLALAGGCKKKAADEGGKTKPAGSGSAATAGSAAGSATAGGSAATAGSAASPTGAGEVKTVALPGGTATLTVPAGWTDAAFGAGRMYSAADAGIFPSTIVVNEDCLGVCGKIADNLAEAATKQIETHKGSGYTAELVGEAKLDADGLRYELKVTKDAQTFTQVFRYLWKAGQEKALGCMATAMKPELEAPLRAACAELTFAAATANAGSADAGSATAGSADAGSADAGSAGSAAAPATP
jgi:hypothetical protein